MDEFESLSHTKWECKYHVAIQKESRIEEGHLMPDHVHMMISIPPKYAVSQVIGYVKGKSAIHLARVYGERRRNFVGQHFWARLDRRERRSGDPGLHQEPGKGRSEAGSTEPLALIGHHCNEPGTRQRPLPAALSGSQKIKPPALPGDSYFSCNSVPRLRLAACASWRKFLKYWRK